ncbi:MAG: hypothetical protein KY397_05920 [Gemmatimonadetes bacterium]|nr:hypothetical protein [Gemmatimonadota bacterium]
MRRPSFAVVSAVGLTALLRAAPAAGQDVRARGVDSLQVRANLQSRFDTTTVDEEPSTEWSLRRARVGVRMFAAGFIRGDVEIDVGRGRARLTDGYVRLSLGDLRVQAGQFKRPFDALELTSSRELLVVERDGSPRGARGPTPNGLVTDLGHAARDIGAMATLRFGGGSLSLAGFNGEGDNEIESTDGKQAVARVELGLAGGWTIAGAWSARREEVEDVLPIPELTEGVWRNAFEGAVTIGEYAEPGWKALAQVMTGDNADPDVGGSDDASFLAAQGFVAYHVATYRTPYLIGIEPVGRIGWTDPNGDVDDDEATLWTAGVNVYHHERVKTQLGLDVLAPAERDAEAALRVMAVLGF